MLIEVLRLSHRLPRDERISSHVGLVSRAFGADRIYYSGQKDSSLEESIKRVCEAWGERKNKGESDENASPHFSIEYVEKPSALIKQKKRDGFVVVHLTMYGLKIRDVTNDITKNQKILVVVGSEQVPPEIYELADFNVSVTNQPHSEVAALAITLDRIVGGKEEDFEFCGKIKIVPSEKRKKIERR